MCARSCLLCSRLRRACLSGDPSKLCCMVQRGWPRRLSLVMQGVDSSWQMTSESGSKGRTRPMHALYVLLARTCVQLASVIRCCGEGTCCEWGEADVVRVRMRLEWGAWNQVGTSARTLSTALRTNETHALVILQTSDRRFLHALRWCLLAPDCRPWTSFDVCPSRTSVLGDPAAVTKLQIYRMNGTPGTDIVWLWVATLHGQRRIWVWVWSCVQPVAHTQLLPQGCPNGENVCVTPPLESGTLTPPLERTISEDMFNPS